MKNTCKIYLNHKSTI